VAKARPIPDLSEDDPYALAAAKIVAVRSRELADQASGVLDVSDIERVHDMRVATRRLRAALEVFEPCFPPKRFRAALREVKELADALGERRDRDVTIAALEDFAAAMGRADHAGISSLVERLRSEQAEANEALGPYVTEERMAALSERLSELVADAAREVGEDGAVLPVEAPAARQATNGAPDGRSTNGAGDSG
jgi:CHAD domain-containing protein